MELEEKRESSERLRLNKKIMWGITIISILLAMFYIDKQKVYKEEKPPMPTVLFGEQELHPILSTYTWNAGEIEKEIKDLTKLIEYQHAEFRENLNIEFPKDQQPIFIARGNYYNGGIQVEPYQTLYSNFTLLRNESRKEIYSIKAYWKDGKRAEYIIPVNIKEISPEKSYLARNKGYHSLLIVGDTDSNVIDELYSEPMHFLFEASSSLGLKDANAIYPELKVKEEPSYILFDQTKEVFRAASLEELLKYMKENTYSKKRTIEGKVTKLDRNLGVIQVDDKIFTAADMEEVKVGQKISLEVIQLNKDIPYYRVIENINVIKAPDTVFSAAKWLAKDAEKVSILAIGPSAFTEQFKSPNKEDFKLVENIEIQETLTLKNGEAITDAAVYVFNDKELVFQTDEFDQLLNYLFEFEMLMPARKERNGL
ncbi:hypothetical protein [Cytobacillus oceanisediminis]|uniref:hypothetical protein n=1 Tax=Cytobacillus oceanisediminis TaxID=665099 RepID=UPI001C22A6B8|nr:hypothetical protein [Cytobacillus oceanisediminis]MBU8769727.1 hypothetical protein [Cytobacillus oceanisediminis]